MPIVGFQPTITEFEWARPDHDSNHSTTVIGRLTLYEVLVSDNSFCLRLQTDLDITL
jgi:hypothetical protein